MYKFILTAFVFLTSDFLFAADACQQTNSFPLGHHTFQFLHNDGTSVQSQGWDPAFKKDHNTDKAQLASMVNTYPVGLPGNLKPSDLTKKWTLATDLTSSLLQGKFPIINLSNVQGQVYLIDSYDGSGKLLTLNSVNVAISRSAFQEIQLDANSRLFLVDSLLDQNDDQSGGFRMFGLPGCVAHVMYSEILGGDDISKGRHIEFYRNHLHGASKTGGEHSDGIQTNGGNCTFIYENTIDFLFRMTNGAVYISAQNDISNIDVVNNLVSGGGNGIKGATKTGTMKNVLLCGNKFLGKEGNTSWQTDTPNGSAPIGNFDPGMITYQENNTTLEGKKSGKDQLGRTFNFPTDISVPLSEKSRLNARAAQLEQWTQEIRTAAGYTIGNGKKLEIPGTPQVAK